MLRRTVILLLALVVVALIALIAITRLRPEESRPPIAGIPCERERLNFHIHVQLNIFVEGQPLNVPPGVGIPGGCLYWLHTHDGSGRIHIEAPSPREFRLGEFFAIWGKPLSSGQLLDKVADGQHSVSAVVNGQSFQGDPADIPLKDGEVITLEYGPPFASQSP